MWVAIAVIALGLFSIVGSTFIEDLGNSARFEEANEKEKSIIEAEQEKQKVRQRNIERIKESTTDTHTIDDLLDPSVLAYRYNKYFKDLKIDRSIKFDNENIRMVKSSAFPNDKTVIFGSMASNTGAFATVALKGLDLQTDKDMAEFKEIALGFFISVASKDLSNKDKEEILYKELELDNIIKNGGKKEYYIEDIKFTLNNEDSIIGLSVANVKNPQ